MNNNKQMNKGNMDKSIWQKDLLFRAATQAGLLSEALFLIASFMLEDSNDNVARDEFLIKVERETNLMNTQRLNTAK